MKKEFNFMINEELNNKLKDYCEQRNIPCSKAINKIIKIMLPIIKKHHFFSKENNCKYKIIIAVKKIHSHLDKRLYRELKLVHSNLNFYSIAILVRYLLKKFFELLEKKNGRVKSVKRSMKKFSEKLRKRCKDLNYEIVKVKKREKQLSRFPTIQIVYTCRSSIHNIKILNPDLIFN